MIDLSEYTKFNDSVDKYPESMKPVIYLIGLVAEIGEYSNKYKKVFRDHGGQMDRRQKDFGLELGDIAWYLERLCTSLGFTFEEIIEMNMEKLQSRDARKKIHGAGDER